jgi:phage/plasmid-associated DNA primase
MNVAKIIIATNCLPPTLDTTQGWYRRIKIIDFPNQFKEGNDPLLRIPNYEYDNFCKQLTQIGADLLARGIFTNDGSITHRQKEYELRSNPMKQFLDLYYEQDNSSRLPFFEIAEKFQNYLQERRYRVMEKKEIGILLEKEGYEKRYEHVKTNERDTKWLFIYGLREKMEKQDKLEAVEAMESVSISVLPRKKTNIESDSIASKTSELTQKLDLYQSIKQLDHGSGADMVDCQKLMACSDKDFDQYLKYAKDTGMVFECRRGFLKLL